MLCDGLGDGVMVECPSEDLEFLRNMSFGLLQGGSRLVVWEPSAWVALPCWQKISSAVEEPTPVTAQESCR